MNKIKKILSAALMLVFIVSTAAVEANAENGEENRSAFVTTTAKINGKSIKELSDGDRDTVYDIGGTVVEIDLTEEVEIDSISVYTDDGQTPQFIAEVSLDQAEWSVAGDYQNSNISMDNFKLNGITPAKFIRFRFFNDSLLCSGIEIYKKEDIKFVEKDDNIAANPTLYKHQFNDSADTAYEQECEFLASLGIINGKQDGFFKGEDYLTRAEFAKLAVNALNLRVIDMSESVFNDVDDSNVFSDYIYTAYVNDIISGYEDGTFRPDDRVLCQEAYVMVCRMLNYDKVMDRGAEYPYNYIGKLSEEVSLKKIRKSYDAPMTRGEAAILICNTLHAVPYRVSNVKGQTPIYEKDTKTVLESTREIYCRSGVLDAVEQNAIYNIPNNYEKGTVVIGGNKYYYDTDKLTPSYFIGTNVEYYIDNSSDSEYLVFMMHSKNNPNIVNCDVDDVDDIAASYIEITAGENKRKKIKIADDAMMMYNGISYGLYKNSFNVILDNGYGCIKLVENDNDNIYDVVQYTNYVNEEVKIADAKTGILQTESFKIDLNDSDIVCRIYANGLEAGISDIKKGDILSVSASKNTEGIICYDIYIASEKISNVVLASYNSDNREVKMGDVAYKLAAELASPGISEAVVMSKSVDLLIDGFGRICRIVSTNADDEYVYLVCAYEDVPEEGQLITIGLDTKKRELSCEFPISVDKGAQTIKCKSTSELKNILMENNDGREDQLIKYQTNSEGKVKRIEIASQTTDESKLSMVYKSASAKYKWAVTEWDYAYKVDKNTKYLVVPNNIRDYNKYKTNPTLNGVDNYNIRMYDAKDGRVVSVVVMYGENGTYIHDDEKSLFVVSNVSEGVDDDDNIVKILTGYKNGNELTLYEPYENAFENIAAGDTLYVVLDSNRDLFRFQKVTGDSSENDQYCNRLTTVEDINYTEVKDSWRWYNLQNINIYIVDRDKSRNKVTKGTMGDIEVGDKILINIVNYSIKMAVVYKDM